MRAALIPLLILAAPGLIPAQPATASPVRLGSPWTDGEAREPAALLIPSTETSCDGRPVRPVFADDLPVRTTREEAEAHADAVLTFAVDADGRPLSIRPAPGQPEGFGPQSVDPLQAALATWRFPASAGEDCRLTVRYQARRLDEADKGDLLRYFAVTRTRGSVRDLVAAKLGGPGADCGERWGGRRPASMAFPDFLKGRRPPPGGRSWTVLRWNIDTEGRATDVEILGSSGDAELDAEGRRAVAETRMRPGPARTGCVYNFYRSGETLPAPPVTPESQRGDPLENCPKAVEERFAARPNPAFPEAFRERSIEGWALVRFDVASWGEIGNVAVVEAQPAAAFGEAAQTLVRTSRATPGLEAGVRCVVPVRYRLASDPAEAATPD